MVLKGRTEEVCHSGTEKEAWRATMAQKAPATGLPGGAAEGRAEEGPQCGIRSLFDPELLDFAVKGAQPDAK